MIKFEGFELKNTEDSIINRQPSTRPMIFGAITSAVGSLSKAFGATEGSSSWEQKSWLTPEQKKLHKKTLEGYSNLEYEGPGKYQSGQRAEDLEGYKATSSQGLEQLQKEDKLSISGLDKLRSMRADAATRVNPELKGMREVADDAWSSGEHHMDEVRRGATEQLQQADIRARRGAAGSGLGGTALQRLGSRNVMDYGRTVGSAAARVAEQTAMQRQQLKLQALGAAGQLGMQTERLGLEGLQSAGSLQAQQNQMALQDLSQRRGISAGERQFGATHGLNVAQFSEQQAQAQNLWAQTNAQNQNQFALNRLRDQNTAATTQTFKNIKNVKKGSAGLGGALIGAAGTIGGAMIGGPMGAQIGGSLANAAVGSMGYGDGGGGMGGMGQAINMGAQMYAGSQFGGPAQGTGTTTPGGAVGTNVGYNATVPPRAFNTTSMGYGTGAYGEFGDPTGSTGFSGIDPAVAMGGLNEPMGQHWSNQNQMMNQPGWQFGGARPMSPMQMNRQIQYGGAQ